MITVVVIAVALVVAGTLAYAASKPDSFTVSRSAVIAAPAEKIFPLIDDLRAQSSWSPFEKDPNMKRNYGGAPRGKGAFYEWDGNRQVGAGRIAILDSVAPARITLLLEMIRPFKARNTVEFALDPGSAGIEVTWSMHGRQPFMAKLMGLFMNGDKMVGSQFEQGLAKLKVLAESAPSAVAVA